MGKYFEFISESYPAIKKKKYKSILNLPGSSKNMNFIPFFIRIDDDDGRELFLNKLKEDINSFGEFLNK